MWATLSLEVKEYGYVFSHILRLAALSAAVYALAGTIASAQTMATPSPKPTSTPVPAFQYGGNVRFYYFTRTNEVQNAGNPNRFAFNFGGKLHGQYNFTKQLSIGATYFGADPFGLNGPNPGTYMVPLNEGAPVSKNNPLVSKIDNTLPGFSLSSLGEAYVSYTNPWISALVGREILSLAWAPSSDSRTVPSSYQGAFASGVVLPDLTLNVDYINQFEPRTNSNFAKTTLLTGGPIAGQPAPPANASVALFPNQAYVYHPTNGTLEAGLTYKKGSQWALLASYYEFYDIANMGYFEGKYSPLPGSPMKPYVAAQFVTEHNTGESLVGRINNDTFGMQLGASLSKNIDFAASFDEAPWHFDTVTGVCGTTTPNSVNPLYFFAGQSQTNCKSFSPGTATVAYGGIASPYTDNYATDPLYTTQISQGMVDRHAAGQSFKVAATVQTN
ncbi:MAG: hypothetical protein ACXWNP_16585, partial [Vulcanimicrobiaceae bacterium]